MRSNSILTTCVLACCLTFMWGDALARQKSADTWLAEVAAPELKERLATHPRFKGQSVRIVVFVDDQPAALSNMLALSFRDHLADAVIDIPAIRVVSARSGGNAPDCASGDVHYLIGLQVSPLRDEQVRIELRVLDAEDGTWVPGFDLSWRGSLSRSQRWELAQPQTDPAFRGHRSAPFEETQSDLLATTIARELGCQSLRQMHGEYVVMLGEDAAGASIPATAELVADNLAAYQPLQFTSDPDRANSVLRGKAHVVDGDLHQYWVTIAPIDPAADLPTLSASAYVRSAKTHSTASFVPPGSNDVLTTAQLVRLEDTGSCQFDASACVAMQVQTQTDAVVFFLNHQKSHGLVRLSDADCGPRTNARVIRKDQVLTQPLPLFSLRPDAASATDDWSFTPPTDTYYAIAVSNSKAAHILSKHLQKLPQRCTAAVRFGLDGVRLENWMREFVATLDTWQPYVDWQAIQVRNVY